MSQVQCRSYSILALLLIMLMGYHLLILFGVLGAQNVWLGTLSDEQGILHHEIASVALISIALAAMFTHPFINHDRWVRYLYRFYAVLLFLNGIANMFANNPIEQYLFTPLALYLSYLFYTISRR